MNTVAYIRGGKDSFSSLSSMEEQEKMIKKYSSKQGYKIIKIFKEDGMYGANFNRPAFQEMLDYIQTSKEKVKFLFVLDLSRLARSTAELFRLKGFLGKKGVKLISVVDSMLKDIGKQPKQPS